MHRLGKSVLWLAVLGCVVLAAVQSRHLARERQAGMPEAYAGYTADPPPALNFVMAGLGAFRGIVSEVLWFRADRLQEEGRFLELVQLSDWLTMLDPHASEAWVYNAWNLAYNISVMMIRPEDRLRWVKNGIALLRDDGLRLNPKDARLYRELAWMYMNKIGSDLDEACETYQRALADAMAPCLEADGRVKVSAETREKLKPFRLDPDRMAELEKRFGPLDWRLAESHAVYWGECGVAYATGHEALMCRRVVYQSLVLLVLHSKTFPKERKLALLPAVTDYLDETAKAFPSRNITGIFMRFLAQAAAMSHEAGDDAFAEACHARFLTLLPPTMEKPTLEDLYRDAEQMRAGKM